MISRRKTTEHEGVFDFVLFFFLWIQGSQDHEGRWLEVALLERLETWSWLYSQTQNSFKYQGLVFPGVLEGTWSVSTKTPIQLFEPMCGKLSSPMLF